MKQRYLVDSSIRVAYFNRKEKDHQKAIVFIGSLQKANQKIVLPEIVFVETLNVLKRRHSSSAQVLEMVQEFFFGTQQIIHCTFQKTFLKNQIIGVIMKVNLKSSDLQILAHAIENKCKLSTYDLKLEEEFHKISKL